MTPDDKQKSPGGQAEGSKHETPDIVASEYGQQQLDLGKWVSHPFNPILDPQPMRLAPSLIPPSIRPIVRAVARALDVPVELPFACCLGIAAAICQSKFSVRIHEGWEEPVSLFLMVLADPGDRKSPTLKPLIKPLIEWEKQQRERCQTINTDNETKQAVISKQIKTLESKASQAEDTVALIAQIEQLKQQLPTLEVPPRLFTDDCTPERLVRLMEEHQGCMSVITDEGGAFLNRIGGSYNRGEPNVDGALKGWDNGPVRVDRSNGNDVFLNCARLSMLLLVQKSVGRKALAKDDFVGRGLIPRFLFFISPTDHMGRRSYDGRAIPVAIHAAWEKLLNELLQWSPAKSTATETETHRIDLSDSARKKLLKYARRLEKEFLKFDEEDPCYAYRQKWVGQIARIAGVLHCLEMANAGKPGHTEEISKNILDHAIAIGEVLLSHADATLILNGLDLRLERARRILKRIRSAEDGVISRADLWQRMRGAVTLFGKNRKTQFDEAIELLFRHGYISSRSKGKTEYVRLTESASELA